MNGLYENFMINKINGKNVDEMEEKIYNLKTIYYEDDTIESILCSLIQNKWKVEPNFLRHNDLLQQNQSNNKNYPLLNQEYYHYLQNNIDKINSIIKEESVNKPFSLSYFGLETLQNKYLIKTHEGHQESIDYMFMRVASFVKREKWDELQRMYKHLREGYYIHATPTLFNAGTRNAQMASCFLLGSSDNIESIFESIGDCAKISKFAGGIGLHIHDIRSSDSYIYGTNGTSNGIIPMLKVYNDTARYIDQGGGKRNGAFAIYLECYHADIIDFLLLKKNVGSDEARARDLFYALWVCDYFMKCVEKNNDWYLMNPSDCVGLADCWGDKFQEKYMDYVKKGMFTKKIKARDLWIEICKIQIETGTPYILFKDTCNRLSNQQNLGTIKSSNLCTEIIQYSDFNEYAVCNLASIGLTKYLVSNPKIKEIPELLILGKKKCSYCKLAVHYTEKNNIPFEYRDTLTDEDKKMLEGKTFPNIFIKRGNDYQYIGGFTDLWENFITPVFDYNKLGEIVQELVGNLNDIIDKNMYPLEKCEISNLKHRPLGVGVQGLADVFMQLLIPYTSTKARELNSKIFECMYYNALKKSNELARIDGHTYQSFEGSPLSKGKFHFELYEDYDEWKENYTFNFDWEQLRKNILKDGVKNSLFLAPMPTASTSQILNNTESFEPLTSNFYLRRTQNGEFYVMNRNMQKIFKVLNIWDKDMHQRLIYDKGSVLKNERVPPFLREIYKTVWEIPQKHCIEMAASRQRFIDQSQSMNIYLNNPTVEHLTKILMYGWKNKLKTGCYYVRSRILTTSQNFSIDIEKEQNYKACENCSS